MEEETQAAPARHDFLASLEGPAGLGRRWWTPIGRIYTQRSGHGFGLFLLQLIREEADAVASQLSCGALPLSTAVQRWPLYALHSLIADLSLVRRAWEDQLLTPSSLAAVVQQDRLQAAQLYALLFSIGLWQRRYPLKLLCLALQLYQGRFTGMKAGHDMQAALQAMERTLEELSSSAVGKLSATAALMNRVPALLRCDVLMTYPHMEAEVQYGVMASIMAALRHPAPAPPRLAEKEGKLGDAEKRATAATQLSSTAPLDPQVLLRGYMEASVSIPPRCCGVLDAACYQALRRALERHKRDGVLRLARHAYSLT